MYHVSGRGSLRSGARPRFERYLVYTVGKSARSSVGGQVDDEVNAFQFRHSKGELLK